MSRHLLGIRHLEPEQIEHLLAMAKEFKKRVNTGKPVPSLQGHVLGMLFFENSTRTRVSFEQAAAYLDLRTANFAAQASSMAKGETLKDTVLTLRFERLDGLVMRHKESGASTLAARYFGGPVVNAGDGQHEHPTQALADALTILERKGTLEGLVVAIVGDVDHSRVARSNAWLLSKMGAEVRFVGPRTLLPSHTGMLPGQVFHDLASGIADADVVMCLRLQKERMDGGIIGSIGEYAKLYQINRDTVRLAKKDCLVMHPGPLNRGIELDDVAADSELSAISAQVENGIFVRMAALAWVFEGVTPARRVEQPAPKAKEKAKK
ncbi:MAG: aspartate carbamoyltransferase catalytic subunit [Armatimonadetes bacterium]|nr:aspartate carbamoyltransferase catalytic subunit [Armatimonadota bacterium]MCA1996905.1 aspartate carbamoyltransferase catalytic subunit [Armatimonadota bacterium]